jgi:drug/metabolite transporter (DMT)-like permease
MKLNPSDEKNSRLGTWIVLLQCLAAANMIVFQKKLLVKYDPAFTTFVYYTIGTLMTVAVCTAQIPQFTSQDFAFNGNKLAWIAVAYAAVFATLFAYNASTWSGKRLPPSVTTVYSTLQPVGTAILSYLVLSVTPTVGEGVGGVVIAAGLVITVYSR